MLRLRWLALQKEERPSAFLKNSWIRLCVGNQVLGSADVKIRFLFGLIGPTFSRMVIRLFT